MQRPIQILFSAALTTGIKLLVTQAQCLYFIMLAENCAMILPFYVH